MRLFHPEFNFLHPRYWFGQVDSRPLSVFRIAFTLVLLKDAIFHFPLARWFYTDEGIYPREVLLTIARDSRFSLMDAISQPWQAHLFFWVWIAVLLGLLVGYRTRWMAVLNFILLLSIHERNIYFLSGYDTVLRTVSFWMMFVSLGNYYSVDAIRRRVQRYQRSGAVADLRVEATPHTTFALPVRLLQMQIAMIYVFTFLLKTPGEAWHKGDAIYYALQVRSLTLPTGDWALTHAPIELLRGMTWLAFVTEGTFALLVFLPFFQPVWRMLGLFLGFMLHLGIASLMALHYFSSAMWAAYLTFFLPGWVRWLDDRLRAPRQPAQIAMPAAGTFDWWLLTVTRPEEIEIAEDNPPDLQEPHSLPLPRTQGGERELLAHLPLSRLWLRFGWARWGIMGAVQLLPVIAAPRVPLGSRPMPRLLTYAGRGVLTIALVPLMVLVIWWNMTSLRKDVKIEVQDPPQPAIDALHYVGLWQAWNMFAPYPITIDGWIIIPGVFENGATADLRTGQPPADTMPRTFLDDDQRWKKYESRLYGDEPRDLLWAWGAYYCRLYNVEKAFPVGRRLATLEIVYRYRPAAPPGEPLLPYQDYRLWQHWCYDEYEN